MFFHVIYCSKCSATVSVPFDELPLYPEEWLEMVDTCDCAPVTIKGRSQDYAMVQYEVELSDEGIINERKVDRFEFVVEGL